MGDNNGWQTIDSAPKDGTEIILSDGDFSYFGLYMDGRWNFMDGLEIIFIEDYLYSKLNYWVSSGPTHWMPRPTPPEEQQ